MLVLLQRCRTEFSNFNKQTRSIQQYESITKHYNSIFNDCRLFPPKYIALKKHIELNGVNNNPYNDNNEDNVNKKESLNQEYHILSQEIAYKRLRGIYGIKLSSYSILNVN